MLHNAHANSMFMFIWLAILQSCLRCFMEFTNLVAVQGWVILHDTSSLIETARALSAMMKWEARVVETGSTHDEKLLICQKPFFKKQLN